MPLAGHAAPVCEQAALAGLNVDGVTVISAAHEAGGTCTVFGTLNTGPAPEGSAGFQMRLPDQWNRKFIFFGVGGFGGTVTSPSANEEDVRQALKSGYATVITDTGHQAGSTDASWALMRPGVPAGGKMADFLYRATHAMTVAGKALVQRYYGQPIGHAYFDGCSNGGHQGMTEAADYPADYDGIIAGAPLFDDHAILGGLHFILRDFAASANYLPPAKLPAINAAVMQSCDTADGVRDGLIQNPAACGFDAATLICKGAETDACLTPGQATTLDTYLTETRDADGAYVYAGWSVAALAGADIWNMGAVPPTDFHAAEPWGHAGYGPAPVGWRFVDHELKFMVAEDPGFDIRRFPHGPDGSLTVSDLKAFDSHLGMAGNGLGPAGFSTSPPAYANFLSRGGKLLIYHGLADPAISPLSTMRFYEQLAAGSGGYEKLGASARLFLVPGLRHCAGGDGPDVFDTLTPLDRWVVRGVPPDAIEAVHRGEKTVDRSMPLCPFPREAVHVGAGDVKDAANWACTDNQKMLEVGRNGREAGLR